MTAMFPDSGVPPSEAKNSLPDPTTQNCNELWYSTSRCQPRFDPAAANAMLAEQINLINKGEVTYNCQLLDQVQLSVRYLIQRGLTNGAMLAGGPSDYTCKLDPVLTRYNDYLTLVVIPNTANAGPVRIAVDSFGLTPLLRNDGQQLVAGDLTAVVPILIAYYGGFWYHIAMVKSQLPPELILSGSYDLWVRTDGNDSTGDGSANDPAKAFRTVRGAWAYASGNFMSTPQMNLHFRLGIPGTYEGFGLGPFGGKMTLTGDVNARTLYKFVSIDAGNNIWCNAAIGSCTIELIGITMQRDIGTGSQNCIRASGGANVMAINCDVESLVGNNSSSAFHLETNAQMGIGGNVNIYGRSLAIGTLINCYISGYWVGGTPMMTNSLNCVDCPIFSTAIAASALSVMDFSACPINSTNCTGVQYGVDLNSVIRMRGTTPPGNQPGMSGSGGQYVP